MKTVEFKLTLNRPQKDKVDTWLNSLKSVWNVALNHIEEFHRFFCWDKNSKSHVPCCPMPIEFRTHYIDENKRIIQDRSKRVAGTPIQAISCSIVDSKTKGIWYSCPLKRDWVPQLIEGCHWMRLIKTMRSDNITKYPWIEEIPYKFRLGTIQSLSVSWQEYLKSRKAMSDAKKKGGDIPIYRGRPQFKRRKDTLNTLINPDPKTSVFLDKTQIDRLRGMPKLGLLKVKGLSSRWKNRDGTIPAIAVAKITHRPSGYFLQLTGDIMDGRGFSGGRKVPRSDKAVGIDVGLKFLAATDDPNKQPIIATRHYHKSERRLGRIQRKITKKREARVIAWMNNSTTTAKDIANTAHRVSLSCAEQLIEHRPLSSPKIRALTKGKTPVISNHAWQSLKYQFESSAKEEKLTGKLRSLHEVNRLRRKAFNHKISTFLVLTFAAIACENINIMKLVTRSMPVKSADGKGYEHNQSFLQAMLSKLFADNAPGDLLALTEQKAKAAGREFARVPHKGTTERCPNCDHWQEVPLSTRTRLCEKCGLEICRDLGAAIKIRALAEDGYWQNKYRRSPGESLIEDWRNGVKDVPKQKKSKKKVGILES